MKKLLKKHSARSGLPPGTLLHTGQQKVAQPIITAIDYNSDHLEEKQILDIAQCADLKKKNTITWINIDGLHDTKLIEQIGQIFNIHPLTLEDIVSVDQRPKFEAFDENYIFVALNMLTFNNTDKTIDCEQVSLILGENFVLSFQEKPGDVFENIRQRIRQTKGRIRKMNADYLAYTLIDAIVDNYFLILENFGEIIESLEDELITDPTEKTFRKIHSIKREMILIRKSIWPLREVINGFKKSESKNISQATEAYFSDVYDHTIQIIDTIESFRDMVSGMIDLYLSSLSNKMNAVMKVLTIIATIFIPLGFFAGVYGMNFDHMPELHCKWAYPFGFWIAIIIIVAAMLYFFKRKKWL
ncbi:MAG: magnesium/cobalt transporter CorA [Sedimentisphaerales bacterium]|nr:magnesium/cobalt transporter CorA [Sedimentisphaerales bacterium]